MSIVRDPAPAGAPADTADNTAAAGATADPYVNTPFQRIGGREVIARLVDRFYDLMDENPRFAELRAMHKPDLAPMRESLTDFLMAWMGGPRIWFEQRPGACMMSVHKGLPGLDAKVAQQWIDAMRAAADDTLDDPAFSAAMIDALGNVARAMAR